MFYSGSGDSLSWESGAHSLGGQAGEQALGIHLPLPPRAEMTRVFLKTAILCPVLSHCSEYAPTLSCVLFMTFVPCNTHSMAVFRKLWPTSIKAKFQLGLETYLLPSLPGCNNIDLQHFSIMYKKGLDRSCVFFRKINLFIY